MLQAAYRPGCWAGAAIDDLEATQRVQPADHQLSSLGPPRTDGCAWWAAAKSLPEAAWATAVGRLAKQ
eukprot:8018770-Lingulodinium_polyedra.AAC.1